MLIHKLEPYIAPEEFTGEPYDARKVDLWSCGIIYYAMIFHGVPWRSATMKDPNYVYYIEHRHRHFEPFLRLPPALAHLLGRTLEPDPNIRMMTDEMQDDPFFKAIEMCDDHGRDSSGRKHHHFTNAYELMHETQLQHQQPGHDGHVTKSGTSSSSSTHISEKAHRKASSESRHVDENSKEKIHRKASSLALNKAT
jgi:serine/threonine protein kinase